MNKAASGFYAYKLQEGSLAMVFRRARALIRFRLSTLLWIVFVFTSFLGGRYSLQLFPMIGTPVIDPVVALEQRPDQVIPDITLPRGATITITRILELPGAKSFPPSICEARFVDPHTLQLTAKQEGECSCEIWERSAESDEQRTLSFQVIVTKGRPTGP
ncbi:MAG: hypothetical protein IID44_03540 [Planctomycetes bacterium]|nr:hypothetical protein [Planctomycetota bacterium]